VLPVHAHSLQGAVQPHANGRGGGVQRVPHAQLLLGGDIRGDAEGAKDVLVLVVLFCFFFSFLFDDADGDVVVVIELRLLVPCSLPGL
jgi:hypothetical protein